MKDIELLTKRFLAGDTTREEELRLHALLQREDITEEQKIVRDMICPPADEPDVDAWLMEDMTEEYDRIVAGRRRRTFFVRFAAAAAVVAFVFLAVQKIGNREDDKALVIAKAEATHVATPAEKLLRPVATAVENSPQTGAGEPERETGKADKAVRADALGGELLASAAPVETVSAGMTQTDSLSEIIERIERGLENVSDSVYIARVEELIESDARLQKLMNNVMIKKVVMDDKNMEAYEQW